MSDRTPTVSTITEAWREARGQEAGFAGVEWNRVIEVEATTLDALIAAHGEPAFVKLDMEGGELAALRGLTVPVKGVSFEYLGGALEAAEACASQLAGLAPTASTGRPASRAVSGRDTWLDHAALVVRLVGGRARPITATSTRGVEHDACADRRPAARAVNTPRQILVASLIGTAIEFFDFYIYATAAVLVFPRLFFPASDPATATLASLATFAIAFVARPIGSVLFGHFGDRVGRKTTLVAALLTMGVSTVAIGTAARPTTRSGSPRRCCWRCAASARGSASAANGAAPSCWPPRTRRPASARGTGCSRSSARRSASSSRAASSCCSRGC